ncbi:MAG TPA: DUF4328 domain-containing protein [Caulobacterales bacterium]|nr:DUF4328 domain-containing protein [Caulobacterales bacterium]
MTTSTADARALRDPSPLWAWLRVLIVIYMLASAAATAANSAYEWAGGADPNFTPETPNDLTLLLALLASGVTGFIAFLLCVFFTCRLTFRLMKNLHELNAGDVSISPGWAVGFYFIPFVNLYWPMKAVAEIWRGTFAELDGQADARDPRGQIGWWWAFWILGNALENIGNRVEGGGLFTPPPQPPSEQQLSIAVACWGVSEIFTLLCCIFMLRVFGKLTKAQAGLVRVEAVA